MNDTIPNDLVEKIRKLLALGSNNSSQEEAELAMQKAKALAVKFDIELSTIQVFEPAKKDEPIIKSNQVNLGKRESVCQKFVSWILQNHFKVKIIYGGSRNWGKNLTLIGKRSDIEIAAYIQFYLNAEFIRQWHSYREKNPSAQTKERNSFLWGAYNGLSDKLKKAEQAAETEAFTEMTRPVEQVNQIKQTYALAKVDHKNRLDKALEEFYPRLRKASYSYTNGTHSPSAREAGYNAGQSITLRRVLNSGGNATIRQ